jgi:hypothetical protein
MRDEADNVASRRQEPGRPEHGVFAYSLVKLLIFFLLISSDEHDETNN